LGLVRGWSAQNDLNFFKEKRSSYSGQNWALLKNVIKEHFGHFDERYNGNHGFKGYFN